MPTYAYRCRTCGHELEVQQSFSDAPLSECPACQGELRKVFTPVGITFKGSGFYKTDSRSGGGSRKSSGSSSTNGDSAGKDSASSSGSSSSEASSSAPAAASSSSGD